MSTEYKGVLWNSQKKRYDRYLWIGILLFLITYTLAQLILQPNITPETLIIRGTGLVSLFLLHLILCIGPLSRLDKRWLPLLYNRRHMGVSMFLLATIHGVFNLIQFHALGDVNPFISLFVSNPHYDSFHNFPFQVLGFFALLIFFLMAATSHDFWLHNLSPRIWKGLHMMVYLAYALVIAHVALGAFQYESHPLNWIVLLIGFLTVSGLHFVSASREMKRLKSDENLLRQEGYVQLCSVNEIEDNRAKTAFIDGENIAVFKYDGKLSAIHNVCKHQMGPLGEGKVVDGCITCPWHGYQYLPGNGQSPPPFTEKVHTYDVQVLEGNVWVNPRPNGEGVPTTPASIIEEA